MQIERYLVEAEKIFMIMYYKSIRLYDKEYICG